MDRAEAQRVADGVLNGLRGECYDELVARFLNKSEWHEATAESGVRYQVHMQGFWDSGKPGDLRVMVSADDGSWRGFVRPCATDFIIAPNGTFVGEE